MVAAESAAPVVAVAVTHRERRRSGDSALVRHRQPYACWRRTGCDPGSVCQLSRRLPLSFLECHGIQHGGGRREGRTPHT